MLRAGNVQSALQMTDELLTIVPTHQRALSNKVYYLDAIEKNVAPLNIDGKVRIFVKCIIIH